MADEAGRSLVALVAGATRGAGRAIAVELARAGFFVYAAGRSSRAGGPSELGRPETIEDTGDLIRTAGATWPPMAGNGRTARALTGSADSARPGRIRPRAGRIRPRGRRSA
jgi:NAD(P)-dependent dehydrogenase (short-subunit alcohol dehydrogenase family)